MRVKLLVITLLVIKLLEAETIKEKQLQRVPVHPNYQYSGTSEHMKKL